ncbi:MAG: protein-glutamate O-methyltransferase CheR [Sandaracinaceae bacterium]
MSPRPEHDYVRSFVRERAAIVLDENKGYLIDGRLASVCRQHGFAGLPELVGALRADPRSPIAQVVIDALTTNETSFFRDVSYYDALRQEILPELIERRRTQRALTIWSAACSTGQEPYSLAMILAEQKELEGWRIRILATDIDETVLARARTGEFTQLEVNRGLPARQLIAHFEKHGDVWRVKDDVRRLITFEKRNLATRWPAHDPFDLVMLRNVLIYFDTDVRRDILHRAHAAIRPGGYLVLGGAESTINLCDAFVRVRKGKAVLYSVAA